MTRASLRTWESEHGQESEVLACPVWGNSFLSPTAKGTSRPHRRWVVPQASRDRVRELRRDVAALQSELDQALDLLESNVEQK
ncbi:MAG TPA: hypothetical protein VMV09_09235 [Candidatus Saccharimonadales bacterium]|nr:hypothetical protein [Candidatus Saccharimonadales bacterium]